MGWVEWCDGWTVVQSRQWAIVLFGMSNYATIGEEGGPFSLVRFQPPIDITQKLQAYEKAKQAERSPESKPSPEDILNILLPPREWHTPHNHYFMQYVSHDRPQREDVEKVQAALDEALVEQQARHQGICPIRESLFAQVYDEIIRQVAINCPERGLMLLRLRDERKMTMAAYETAYQAGMAYGVRKQLEAEEGMGEMEAEVRAMEFRREELARRKAELLSKQGSMQQKIRERKAADSERKEYELQCLVRQNDSLRTFVEARKVVEKPPEPEEEEET